MGDLVLQFIEVIPDGQFRGDLGDGVAGGLAGQGRRAAHAGVDLHHDQFFGLRVEGELHVATAGKVAEVTHHADGRIAHALVGRIAQCHGRRHGDRIAGMHAHRIEVLHPADDHHIVLIIPQQFQFEFFPAQYGFFHQYFVDRAGGKAGIQGLIQFFLGEHDASAGTTQGEGRTQHEGEPDLLRKLFSFEKGVGDLGRANRNIHFDHPLAEFLPVFRLVNSLDIHTDQPYPVLFPDTQLIHFFAKVEGGLSAHGRQYGVYLIFFQYLFDAFHGQGQQVYPVGHHRVGHDGGGVAVDQDHFHAFFTE